MDCPCCESEYVDVEVSDEWELHEYGELISEVLWAKAVCPQCGWTEFFIDQERTIRDSLNYGLWLPPNK